MPSDTAHMIVAEAVLLRWRLPDLSAIEVLDKVMRGQRGRPIDFGELALPPSPLAKLVAEAFGPLVHANHSAELTWLLFRVRYGLF